MPFTFEDVGERQLTNIEQAVRAYRLHVPGGILHGRGHARQPHHHNGSQAFDRARRGGSLMPPMGRSPLHITRGKRSEAARLLRIDTKTLYVKMKRYRILGRVVA